MGYKQIIGKQGKSYFLLSDENNVFKKSVIVDNTCPDLSFKTVGEIVQNWNGNHIDNTDGNHLTMSFEFLNVLSGDADKVIELFEIINLVRKNKKWKLRLIPYFTLGDSNNYGLYVLPLDTLTIDNVKKFINTGQKIVASFISKYKINNLPTQTSPNVPIDPNIIGINGINSGFPKEN